jgi:hypothetical protein
MIERYLIKDVAMKAIHDFQVAFAAFEAESLVRSPKLN